MGQGQPPAKGRPDSLEAANLQALEVAAAADNREQGKAAAYRRAAAQGIVLPPFAEAPLAANAQGGVAPAQAPQAAEAHGATYAYIRCAECGRAGAARCRSGCWSTEAAARGSRRNGGC